MSPLKNNFIEPVYCDCKMKFHESCLIRCYKEGLLCPICRIKDDILESSEEEYIPERTITINPILIPTVFEKRKILLSKLSIRLTVFSMTYLTTIMFYHGFFSFFYLFLILILEKIRYNLDYNIKKYNRKYNRYINRSHYRNINNRRI